MTVAAVSLLYAFLLSIFLRNYVFLLIWNFWQRLLWMTGTVVRSLRDMSSSADEEGWL